MLQKAHTGTTVGIKRMTIEKPEPRSRRDRPAKAPLSRQVITEAALAIMRTEGLGKVTMRRIAAQLDTGAASLYVYVRDTEDLHAQVLDALLAPVTEITTRGSWQKRLKALLGNYMDVLFANPELARMAISTPANGTNYFRIVEMILALLKAGGVEDRSAAWGVDLLLLFATANAAEHSAWKASPRAAEDVQGMKSKIRSADPKTHPNISRLSEELLSGGEGRLDWNLDLLIAGLIAAPPVSKKSAR